MVDITVEGELDSSSKIPVLTLRYVPAHLRDPNVHEVLREKLVDRYNKLLDEQGTDRHPSCVVVMDADTAGSPLIRALYELYKTVTAKGGRLGVVQFPIDYIPSLSALGMLRLDDFKLSGERDEAIQQLTSTAS